MADNAAMAAAAQALVAAMQQATMALAEQRVPSGGSQRNIQFRGAKLNDGNYREWAFEMEEHLSLYGLFGVVSGSEGPPAIADADRDRKLAEYDKKGDNALHVLRLAVDYTSQKVHIHNKNTAKAIWDSLKLAHQRTALVHTAAIERELRYMRLRPGSDVRAFVNRMHELSIQLAECGEDITPQQLGRSLLMALDPDEWRATLQVLNSTEREQLTFDFVKKMLIDNLASPDSSGSSYSGSSGAALYVRAPGPTWQPRSEQTRCHKCGEPGHIAIC
jgi:hypothetical protein